MKMTRTMRILKEVNRSMSGRECNKSTKINFRKILKTITTKGKSNKIMNPSLTKTA